MRRRRHAAGARSLDTSVSGSIGVPVAIAARTPSADPRRSIVAARLTALREPSAGRRGPWGGSLLEPDVLLGLAERPPATIGALADVPGVASGARGTARARDHRCALKREPDVSPAGNEVGASGGTHIGGLAGMGSVGVPDTPSSIRAVYAALDGRCPAKASNPPSHRDGCSHWSERPAALAKSARSYVW